MGLNRASPGRRRGPGWLEAAVILVGAVVLLGWLAGAEFVKSVSTSSSMKPNTALSFVLAGAALWLLHEHRERRAAPVAAWLLASAVTMIGLFTLTEYAFGWDLHIDELLFHDASGSSPPGRMGQGTAIAFALVGLSLLLLDVELREFRPAQAGALAAGVIALVTFTGFLYDVPADQGGFTGAVASTAPHTSLAFLVLAVAVLRARPRCGVMALIQGPGLGAATLRRLLVPVIAIPLVVGWLRLEGERVGFYGLELGLAMMIVSAAVLSIAVVYIVARSLERTDDERAQARKGEAEALRESKQAEAEIRALNEELEQRVRDRTAELEAFTYSVSHDLRAPLRAIDGFSHILASEYGSELPPEGRRYLDIVGKNVQDMGQLIDGLLDLSRLGQQVLSLTSVDLAALAREAVTDLEAEHEDRTVEISVGELPTVRADRVLLKQVLVNLLSNAFKFTRGREPATIEVSSEQQDGERVFLVRDNGVGFDMRHADKLFRVFERLHRKEEYEGTGLGLALVERIVRQHGGSVWAEGTPDEGASFYFTLEGGKAT